MTTVLTTKRPENFERRERIRMMDGSDFTIILRQPTFEFHVDVMTGKARLKEQFEKLVIGWDGVNTLNDKGEEIALGFSVDTLKTICENYPCVFNQICGCILDMQSELPPVEGVNTKNSEPPSGQLNPDGGTESATEIEKTSSGTTG